MTVVDDVVKMTDLVVVVNVVKMMDLLGVVNVLKMTIWWLMSMR